jgi:TldD protein
MMDNRREVGMKSMMKELAKESGKESARESDIQNFNQVNRNSRELDQGFDQGFDQATKSLLISNGLDVQSCHQTLGFMHQHVLDEAEIYLESSVQEHWGLEDSVVKNAGFSSGQGLGVRAISGEKTGFAYADEISPAALHSAANAARGIAKMGVSNRLNLSPPKQKMIRTLYTDQSPLKSLEEAEKIQMLRAIDEEARRLDPRVTQVMASLNGSFSQKWVISSDGTLAAEVMPMSRLNVTVIMESNGRREEGYAGCGARKTYEMFADEWKRVAHEAVRLASVSMEAKPAPAGVFDVVLGAGWPGILLHEAVGHGLEGDFNRKGVSSFSGKIGQQVASKLCTVIDDGTIPHLRGSLSMDDEGTPSQRTVLIENGILKGYLYDKLNARLSGKKSTGNGRRESYAELPMPRMTNTYLMPGEHTPEEILSSVKNGIYAANFSGGQVDITSGKFVFVCNEAYLIENGKITAPLKDVTLIGDGPSSMNQISMVGNNLALDHGVGVCGKEGQSVPVGVGMPTIRINQMTVGGAN